MIPKLIIGQAIIYAGNNLEVLPELASNSVDSIICDPPYELGFMGKSWDSSGIAYSVKLWEQCLRVLKPGGHLLAFGGTRTWHRLAVAIEDAGFEIRDNIAWLYGSGFPKSHNISKAIDKMAGAEREVIGTKIASPKGISQAEGRSDTAAGAYGGEAKEIDITAPATDDAKKWDGWGTALKPAHEPIVVARKPVSEKTVAANVLKWGTGAINIDASRIGSETVTINTFDNGAKPWGDASGEPFTSRESGGRFPSNVIFQHTEECIQVGETTEKTLNHNAPTGTFAGGEQDRGSDTSEYRENNIVTPIYNCVDGCPVKELDNQTGKTKSGKPRADRGTGGIWKEGNGVPVGPQYGDEGGASRFFYQAKASKKDRNEGLDELEEVRHADRNVTDGVGGDNPRNRTNQPKQNFHPTVKPTSLMQYLIRLVTPENGVVLDPFAGSGSTGKAAILEGKRFIGIELTPEYLPIIEGRLKHAYLTLDDKEADLFE